MKMPLFGICRGEQIINVALGGTLITDIPSFIGSQVAHRCPEDQNDCLHSVNIDRTSEIYSLTRTGNGLVNSFHHQAIDKAAPGMKVTAFSDNGVAEALERIDQEGNSFIMAVQWHPERLKANPGLSRPLGDRFLEKAREYGKQQ